MRSLYALLAVGGSRGAWEIDVEDGEVQGQLAVGSDWDPEGPGVEEGEGGEARNMFVVVPVVELVRGDG